MSLGTSKIVPLEELAARVADGSSLALGGSFLHRGPFALVRELIRQGRKDLEVIKQSPGYDIDILCRAGALSRARAGIVAMEGNFGLAPWYRRAVETGRIRLEEHACASLTAGLRAAAFGVPFMPCGGIHGSDLPALNGWKTVEDPYGGGETVYVIPRITPDFAVIQANEVSEEGDVRVYGTSHWDRIMTRSAKRVLVVAERVASSASFRDQPELTLVPHFLVEAVSIVPNGAWPGSCWPHYEVDYLAVEAYMEDAAGVLRAHLDAAPEAREAAHV
ncbi:CoA transferase subunit A [Methylobacterium oxalidis]|uniref:CoA-transferase n=1 Tax=Methylobacterium oxalidis TaxID=944322 RepID=A0A512JAD1_9HYPH|nr:CoA transferase [Methylobacterium oxalidis]GEP06908.1 CoA-transferase [Methylobacterium oxalidis]GJE33101.1 Glutaconate CoA-transferase subunit A [Methylobacterium oxalidis]GLS64397.1 CoA-transferase [Methylobacterium oxalidis]